MRLSMPGLDLKFQEALGRNPMRETWLPAGGAEGLLKLLWHGRLGMSLYAKRLKKGRFIWPSPAEDIVAPSPAQQGYLLEGIDGGGIRNAHCGRNWQAE
ncbi:uncharacterized protein S101446_03287 (plasmid) [Komagataeibacter europaeus]|nr:uncharacterized protein S101446_03287 [Komagataeibacter europaeus]